MIGVNYSHLLLLYSLNDLLLDPLCYLNSKALAGVNSLIIFDEPVQGLYSQRFSESGKAYKDDLFPFPHF